MLDSKKKAQYLTRKFVNHLMVDGKKEKAENSWENFCDKIIEFSKTI